MRKWVGMRAAVSTAAVVLACACHVPAAAQQPNPPGDKPINVKIESAKLRDALDSLFQKAGAKYKLDPSITNETLAQTVSLTAVNSSLKSLLDTMLRFWGLAYKLDNGVYVIAQDPNARNGARIILNGPDLLAPPPPPFQQGFQGGPGLQFQGRARGGFGRGRYPFDPNTPFPIKKKVSLDLKDADLRSALKTLFDQGDGDYLYTLDVSTGAKITLGMTNAPFEGALMCVLRSAEPDTSLTYRAEYGIVTLLPQVYTGLPATDLANKRVTLRLKGIDLSVALRSLFGSAQARYSVDQQLQGRVTLVLNDVPFRKALESMLDGASPALDYSIEDGTFHIAQAAVPPK